MTRKNYIVSEKDINIEGGSANFSSELKVISQDKDISIFDINIKGEKPEVPSPITIQWKIPAHNVKGVWKPTTDFSKRIQADWELDHMESRISIDAPIINLFGHNDSNRLTFACSNAINKLELNARYREEDDYFYCFVKLFTETNYEVKDFNIQLRVDSRDIHFSESLKDVSKWWETFENLQPTAVPESALVPLYSTWYNFHQNLDEDSLEEECKLAYDLGYKAIIIDDGWQTKDDNRGYDYTGDWNPDRLSKTKEFVEKIHNIGMKVGFWYSVPFCGEKSEAYERFKGKFLTKTHRWAPVFDPRYPDVRAYLINIYKSALIDWNLDGFKLDFIDDFKWYPETKDKTPEMDYHSINDAVDRLLTDVITTLKAIKSDVFIEFRQKYTGPAMRKYGNMFRAFDCPGDATMNRIRIADIKMIAGNTAVHSDMITWHKDDTVEVAALQMINTLFGVPQISVLLKEAAKDHLNMIKFYTNYWNENKVLFTEGKFTPFNPLANYPQKQVVKANKMIVGIYDNCISEINENVEELDFLNAKLTETIVVNSNIDLGEFSATIFNCEGTLVREEDIIINKGISSIEVPACGIIKLTKKQ